MRRGLPAFLLVCCAAPAITFDAHVIAADLKDGYQVIAADVNGDGKLDLIVVDSGGTDLFWYENPSWTRHLIASGMAHPINVAAKDIDGDGIPEIAIAYEFSSTPKDSKGIVAILHNNGDVRQPWTPREIDRLPTSHRLRWAKIGGKDVLVNAPLAAATDAPPNYGGPVPLVLYRPGEWKRELITDANSGVQHGIFVSPHPSGDHILTASFSGIDHYQLTAGKWVRREVNRGDPRPCPKCGAGDVAVGARESIASIEPWHGNQVVVYDEADHWRSRHVIDDTLDNGHTILFADFLRNGRDAIVAGFRGAGGGVRLYQQVKGTWTKSVIESGTPAASCAVAPLTRGRPIDLICVGGSKLVVYSPH